MVEATVSHVRAQCLPCGLSPTHYQECGDRGRSVLVVQYCQQTFVPRYIDDGVAYEETLKESVSK